MTIAHKIKSLFDPSCDLPLDLWEAFTMRGEIINYGKEAILKDSGSVEKYLYFIERGAGGVFLPSKSGLACISLCYENDFFGDYMSFLTGTPSLLYILTFEQSEVFRISKSNFDEILYNNFKAERICRVAAEKLFIHRQQMHIDLLTKTATERYKELVKSQPFILQRTPQKYIASYLGIAPQSLSRIRNSISKG